MDSGIRPASDVGTFNVGGESVTSHNDGLYKKLREHVGVPASFLEKLDFSQLEKFGGKGGKPMTLVQPDRKYLVKELAGDDHKSLLKHGGDIVDHLLRNESLIVPVLLHFTRHGKHYLAMRNCFPSREGTIWHRKYDLKGNRDDKVMDQDGESVPTVNKRCFHFHTCWYGCDMVPLLQTSARQRYYAGKKEAFTKHFSLAAPQAERVIAMCKADAELFGLLGTMDYSLMVGVMKIGTGETVPPADGLKQFVVHHDGYLYVYYLGIIDFLQEWTLIKKVAAAIKIFAPKPLSTVPPHVYSRQFSTAMAQKFKADPTAKQRV